MQDTHVIGVDPGLVHTGVVRLLFKPVARRIITEHEAVVGPDAQAVKDWIAKPHLPRPHTFVEGYKPRSNFNSDARMHQAVSDMKAAFSSTTVLNTGVKKIVRRPLMELLGVWSFTTVTNHQDLRSAARIALYGMLKQPALNRLIADVVHDHLNGETWHVHHQ